jgi:hypothetical protein
MIELVFAAALANAITAPPGIYAHAQWAATRPNVQLVILNRSDLKAWLVDVACNAYDARGALIAVAAASLPELDPGERAATFALAEDRAPAARFACKVTVSDWRRPK